MDAKELCENFIAADKIINDEIDDNLTYRQIINDPEFDKYCSNNNCETDMQINGFGEYLFNQLGKEIENEYYEYFMMWLSDKLFKIANEGDNPQIEDITLNSAYEKYLKKNIKNGIYWSLLDIKKGLKEINLMHMKQFYKLLNHICKAIVYYKPNKDDTEKFINYSTECYNQYLSLYNSVPKCDSYLHLLDNLKKTYEGFKNSVHEEIKKTYPYLEKDLQTLTIGNSNSYFVGKFKAFDFNDSKCKLEKKLPPVSPLPPQPQQVSAPALTLSENSKSVKPKTETSQKVEHYPPPSPQAENKSPSSSSSEQQPILPPAEPPSEPQQASSQEPQPPVLTTNQKEPPDSQNVLNIPEGQLPNQENSPKSSDSGQDNSSSQTKEKGGNIVDKPEQPQDGQQQNSDSKQETSGGASENGRNDLGSQDAGKGGSDTEPKNPTTQHNDQNITQGDSLKQQEDSGNMQLQNIFNIFKGTFEMYRSSFYNTYTDIGNNLYKKASSALENAYDKSRKFASNTLSYLNEHLNKALENVPPSKDNGSEPPPSLPKDKKPEPQNIQTPTPGSQSNDNPQALPPTQNIGSSNSKQVNPSDSPLEKQPQQSVNPSSKAPSLTIETRNTGIIVKENTPQLVNYIYSFKGYNRLEIAITVILIPIILGIAYKYLSSGWRKELKRKKTMKKVINSIGGKRSVEIIISSSSRKKQTKKSINSVHRKKPPLLNIYKLMQADPIPFINLFFLLIFFVYKRKYDFLEL
ncbi:CIR protein PIR protein [Plasmodium vinckei brucechwatti]|uniref:CIR protein PIR protein n=1 Tax=Plasmodium vinckei brucechwatti TaxID=119398 RepID=A0A6V7RUG9_PLAVN|nr:CIR protein PIR protein [Plasmodium vinckei brucechwatti]